MKIGVNVLFLIPGEVGGSETYLRCTLRAAAALNPEHDFVVFANAENLDVLAHDLERCPNVSIIDMRVSAKFRPRRIIAEQTTLPRVAAATGIEVLWNPGNTSPRRAPCPQVTSVYDMQYVHFPEDFSPLSRFFIRHTTRRSLARADLVLTISEFSRREIIEHASVPAEKIRVTPLAADPAFGTPLPGEFVAERVMKLTRSADPYILVVANTYPHKSVETAIIAFGLVAATIPHRLVIVGKPRRGESAVQAALEELPAWLRDGKSADRPEETDANPQHLSDDESRKGEGSPAAKSGISRVTRLYEVTQRDLIALYQGASLFLFPSRYEGFGLPVLEALTAGIPVVTTREASIPEVGGDAVYYVPAGDASAFADAVLQTLSDSGTRPGTANLHSFSWEATARGTVEALVAAGSASK